jgi:hypothetical protein
MLKHVPLPLMEWISQQDLFPNKTLIYKLTPPPHPPPEDAVMNCP